MKRFLYATRFPLVAILAFGFARCGQNKAASPRTSDEDITVKLQPVERQRYSRPIEYAGVVSSNQEARLSFKIGGIISKIYVREGDHVSPGQLLATLDLTEIDAQVQQASQNVDKSKRDEERVRHLYDDTAATLEQLQNSTTQLHVAGEALRIAQFNRQFAQIRATSGGVILQKLLNEGEYASSGSAVLLFNGTDSRDWVVRFGVSDRDWALLKKGDPATMAIDAYPDKSFAGVITKLAESVDATSGTYPVEVGIKPADCKLAPGLFCNIRLQPSEQQTLTLIPAEALVEGDGKTGYVYTLNADGHTVTKNLIHIAFLEKDRIAVNGGLEHVDRLITKGAGYLTERSTVRVAD